MALYGTYRPNNFSSVVGQESIKTTLLHASLQNRVSHASLFCGTRGTGKTTSARIVAKALNCQNLLKNGDPCLKCDMCIASEEGRMTDIIEIDAASNRGIDEIRDLREKVNFSPNFGKAKIYIIDEVHMLTKEAFNALLKTLEEPPAHAYFILATTEFHKVPETIRSRCQTFFFRKISLQDIVGRLEFICEAEGISADRKGIEIIAQRANGGLRDAISLLEQSASYGEISEKNLQESLGLISDSIFTIFLETLSSGNSKKSLSILDDLQDEGRNLEEFGKDFLGVLRTYFHEYLHSRDTKLPWILEVIDIFEDALQKCRSFDIPPLAFELAVAKSMLLQKKFKESLTISSQSELKKEEAVIEKLVQEKHHVETIYHDELENWAKTPPDFKEQKEFIEKVTDQKEKKRENKKKNNTETLPPWEVISSDNQKKDTKHISPYDDDDMFPSSQNISVKKDEKKQAEKNNNDFSGNFEQNVQKHWKDILSLLPKSISTNINKFGTLSSVGNDVIFIKIEGESTRKLLSTEKNIQKTEEVFSEKFEKKIKIEYISSGEENSIPSLENNDQSIFPVKKVPQETSSLEISEVEDLLKF